MAIAAAGCLAFAAMAEKDVRTLDGVPQLDVKVGGFWRSEFRKLSVQWLPHCIRQMEKGGRGEEMLNLVATAARSTARCWSCCGRNSCCVDFADAVQFGILAPLQKRMEK